MSQYGKEVKKKMDTYMTNEDSIDKEVSDIQNAMKGVEVRGALAAGVKKSFDKSKDAEEKSEQAHDVMESIINDGFDNAALESNFEQKLDDKINNLQPEWTQFKEQTNQQLAENVKEFKKDINDVLSFQNKIMNDNIVFGDLIWSWWIYPLAHKRNNKTFVGGVANGGAVYVQSYDHLTKDKEKTELFVGSADDHNAPAIVFTPSGTPIILYSIHNADNKLRYRIGTKQNSIADLGEEKTVTMSGRTSYAQAVLNSNGLFAFVRTDDHQWSILHSIDNGDTWSINKRLFNFGGGNQSYLKIKERGNNIRIALTGHPQHSDVQDIYYCYINTSNGDVVVGGNVIDNVFSGVSLPLNLNQLTKAYSATNRTRLFDVGNAETPEIVIAEFTGNDDGVYKYISWDGSKFVSKDMIVSGKVIGAGDRQYFGGMYLVNSTLGEILVSREENGSWFLEKWRTLDNGNNFTRETIDLTTSEKVFRPVSPKGSTEEIIYSKGLYHENNFTDFSTDIVIHRTLTETLNDIKRSESVNFIQRSEGVVYVPVINNTTGTIEVFFDKSYADTPDIFVQVSTTDYIAYTQVMTKNKFSIRVINVKDESKTQDVAVKWFACGDLS